ncbi:L-lactate permease [Blautia liquoris]|uniref:L-lactate permease n=1 Tax=Blautia liquoris TaxID=2779518 RepID=A0A7M2RIB1_9FIRM|nr:L-lactate permease [Blautia liquoris]QOV19724.1 L-lactate permease [Blautia liquoris]
MNIPVNLFMWIMAFLPIIVLLVLMMKFHWGATEAAPVGLLITIITGVFFYKADIRLIASESAKGIWNALIIILIVWTAILMYQVGDEARAFLVIRNGMRKLLPNELLLILAMGWIFESFLQGITGFGVPVAVGAPLLIGIGVKPMWAVIIPLLGQAWGNTFGTLGAAWDSLAMGTNLIPGSGEYLMTALWAGVFIWIWNVIGGLATCWFYGKGRALKKGFAAVLILSVIQGGGELLLTQINTTISCFVPACISLIVILILGRTKWYREEWSLKDSPIMNRDYASQGGEEAPLDMSLIQAFVPYFLLSFITLAVLLIKPVYNFLGQVEFGLSFPKTVTGYGHVNEAYESFSPLTPFNHASMFLLASSLIGLVYYKKHGWIKKGGAQRIFVKSISMTMPSGIAVICLVIMSKIMDGTGQTIVLANGIVSVLGRIYTALAPFVGFLGTFMTGSTMSSNILFGGFQMTTANLLQVDPSQIMGAQTAGATIGSAISPSKIILGTTTASILGSEGDIMKKILLITLPATILIGLILFVITII